MPLEIKNFGGEEGGGDFDSAPHKIAPHKWVNLENMRTLTTSSGEVGNVESIGSTDLINNPNLPIGNNTVIGSIVDESSARIIYFVYNDQGNHVIFCYDVNAETIYVVLLSSQLTGGLNFDVNTIIHSGFVANGCIYWCENQQNEPRKLNIDAGIALNNPQSNQSQLSIIDNQTTISGRIFNTYTLPINPSQGYGIQIYGQLIRTGTAGQFSNSTIIPFFIDWSGYPTQTPAEIVGTALYSYLQSLGGTLGLDWNYGYLGNSVTIQINPIWDMGTGDPLFAPMTSLVLQLYSVNIIPYTAPIDISIISWIKRQPGICPSIQKVTQTSPAVTDNLIGNDAMLFCYRYIYRDYETSTLSALSTLSPFNYLTDTYNAIDVALSFLEPILQDVIQVDLCVYYCIGNAAFIIKSWRTTNAADNTAIYNHNTGIQQLSYRFYNGQTGIALDPSYFAKPYDIVPIHAKTVNWAKNRAFMANVLMGYDTPSITSMSLLQIPITNSPTVTGIWYLIKYQIQFNSDPRTPRYGPYYTYYIIYVPDFGYYIITGDVGVMPPLPTTSNYPLIAFIGVNLSEAIQYLVSITYVPTDFASGIMSEYINQNTNIAISNFPNNPNPLLAGLTLFKSASPYQSGIVFLDYYGRKCGVATNDSLIINTPESIYNNIYFTQQIQWTVSNTNALNEIPERAYYFIPVITKNLRTRLFLQGRVANASYSVKDYNNNFVAGAAFYNDSSISIIKNVCTTSVATAIQIGTVTFGDFLNNPITFFVGQRVRAYGNPTGTTFVQDGYYIEGFVTAIDNSVGVGTLILQADTAYQPNTQTAIPTPAKFTVWVLQSISVTYCSFDISSIFGFGFGYSFTDGDIIKIYTPGNNVYSLKIWGQVGSWVIADYVDLGNLSATTFNGITGGSLTNNRNFYFEIYTPYKPSLTEPYYEYGQVYQIANPGTLNRAYAVIAGYFGGDVYIIQRSSTETNSTDPQPVSYITENMSPNDKFWSKWFTNAGRSDYIDYIGQKQLDTAIEISETLVDDARSNGLSTFDGTESVVYPECGAISRIILTSKVHGQQGSLMIAVCEQETVSLYLSEVQLVGSTDDIAVTQATNIIGTINVLKGSFGSKRPESVIQFRGNVYFFSDTEGKVIQYSDNGLFPISNYKMTVYWKLFSELFNSMTQEEIVALGSRPFVFSGIDPHNWELIFTVPKLSNTSPYGYLPDYPEMIYPFNIWDAQAKSLVYKLNAEPNFWLGAYNITAEGWASVQNALFAFKNGDIYQCNSENNYGNFFGVQYPSRIMFNSNQLPNKPKVYEIISIDVNMRPSLTYFRTEPTLDPTEQYDLWEQASDLVDFSYKTKEGELYAVILRNKLIPTQSGLLFSGLLNAEKMRALILRVMVSFNPNTIPVELRYISLGFNQSIGHNIS